MERTADIELVAWRSARLAQKQTRAKRFAAALVACACLSALLASFVPLQFSILAVFLFAGPHNWFEFRYFLMRLPVRFGKSRNFFVTAFVGIGVLTISYAAMPLLFSAGVWSDAAWPTVLASWNTVLLLWLGVLVWLRGQQRTGHKTRRDWFWAIPAALALSALNWLGPEFFSLAIVYMHPLVALWFLDRHLRRTRPEWLGVYRRCLCLIPLLLGGMIWQLSSTARLADDNGLFWRITQHAGAQLLPNVSSHMLVSVHLFLEMLHYGVWLVALPLIGPLTRSTKRRLDAGEDASALRLTLRRSIWDIKSVPLASHPRGFPKLISFALLMGVFVVAILWLGFSMDYSTTRDIYFTVAIAHVLAEAPFLLKMI
ncbi:MAG TPA: hypothetical protein VEW46_02405 [Pyrinomonadaceae bacterium]|nr:hypothetical protein [Pyrinomonadaceae bacterium]